jgi:DnaJ-class molecular chaperone
MSLKSSDRDYYQILGVPKEATDEEIKGAYRHLALQVHPDRNPGDKRAEERFKEISEAYGVLIDPDKRLSYNSFRQMGPETGRRPFLGYSQEEIFWDIFRNPDAGEVFVELKEEFSSMGFRFDEEFFERLFFSGNGEDTEGIILESTDFDCQSFGSRPGSSKNIFDLFFSKDITKRGSFIPWLWMKLSKFLLRVFLGKSSGPIRSDGLDLTFTFPLGLKEITVPMEEELSLLRNGKFEKILIRIPGGVQDGTILRLRGKGKSRLGKVGDLYLKVKLEEEEN